MIAAMKQCECGCGSVITPKRWHKYGVGGRFIQGHATRLDAARNVYVPRADEIPSGLCECGCGERTEIATVTDRKKRYFRGHPLPRLQSHGSAPRAESHYRWSGGRFLNSNGYVMVYSPDHPDAQGSYVPEHRLVMEKAISRRLRSDEHVHHKNGKKDDNREQNLVVLTVEEHMAAHADDKRLRGRQAASSEMARRGRLGAAKRWRK